MSALDQVLRSSRLRELDHAELAAPTDVAWEAVRHGDLGHSRVTQALFALRTLPDRLAGKHPEGVVLRLDDMRSSVERPGFQILVETAHEVVIGAIGKVWHLEIPFMHVPDAAAFAAFDEPGWVKVAWALRVVPRRDLDSRVEVEVRVDATDDESWTKFKRYFRVIGIPSRFIRRSLLASLAAKLGASHDDDEHAQMPADELLSDAAKQLTHSITIAAPPAQIWPWLVQMGGGRAGFYSLDLLDNDGIASAREIHPELQRLDVGDVIPATPHGSEGFEVLRSEPHKTLVLGGLFDADAGHQLPFAASRPAEFWQVTWAFALEPLTPTTTRLRVRARAAYPPSGRWHALVIRPVHALMQLVQLRNLKIRAEGRLPRDTWHDILDGFRGAGRMVLDFLTPRGPRTTWGFEEAPAQSYPGDELIAQPRWGWTHAVEIDAAADAVWPWVAQIGANRAGFYSYQWLENLVGCNVRNAETIHPAWQAALGDELSLHPKMPPLRIVDVQAGRYFVASVSPGSAAPPPGTPWVAATWLFYVEPITDTRCRFVSRYRVATSDDLRSRASVSELLLEPIGFAMDRRMLLGVKERAEEVASRA